MTERITLREHARRAARGDREAFTYYMRRGAWAIRGGRHGREIERRWERRADRLYYARCAADGERWDDSEGYERPEGPGRWP